MSTPPEHNVQLTYEQMQQVQQAMYFLAQNRNTPLFLPGNPTNGPTMYPPPNHAGLPQYAAQAGIPAPPGIFPQPMHTVASSASIPPSFQTSIPGSSRSSSSSIPPPAVEVLESLRSSCTIASSQNVAKERRTSYENMAQNQAKRGRSHAFPGASPAANSDFVDYLLVLQVHSVSQLPSFLCCGWF